MLQEHAPVRADRAAGGGVQADRQPPAAAEGAHSGHARQHHQVGLIYEVIMRHIWDKYEAIMNQISIIFSKNEVFSVAIF